MKILQVIDTLAIGGAEKMVVIISNLLHNKKHHVDLLTFLNPGPLVSELNPNIRVIALKRGWKWNPFKMHAFVKIAKDYDIVHVHSSHNLRYVMLSKVLFGLDKPVIYHEHNGNIEINQAVKWHQKFIYPKTTFIGVSTAICDWAIKEVGVPAFRVHLLRNIVANVPYYSRSQSELKKEVNILITANIRRLKNIGFALEVFAAFSGKFSARLTVIGQIADTGYFEELKALVVKLGIEEKVTFIHDCSDIQPILHQFDAALHTSVFESGPLVLIEYAAQGVPFLSYRTGEIARMFGAAFPELVLDHFDIARWVRALEQLLAQDRLQWGHTLRQYFEKHFSEDTYYEQCIKIYQSALHS